MIRNTMFRMFVLGAVVLATTCFNGQQGVARAEMEVQSSTFALGELVLRDSFTDNQQGLLWTLYADNPDTCWVEEVNERLELGATSQAADDWAGYMADAWRLNPSDDFAVKIDFHFDLNSWNEASINLGITPTPENLDKRRVTIGVGCVSRFPYYWYEKNNNLAINSSFSWRGFNDGTLYISYSAEYDELYLGDTGYGSENAWAIFPGLLQGTWEGDPVYVYFGGSSSGQAVTSGHAYLDNLLVELGTVVEAALQEVYRFWSPVTGTHFYTMSETEKEKLLTNYPNAWIYEGVAYHAYPDATDNEVRPIFRFWSNKYHSHFYTISEKERDKLINNYPDAWTYEGDAFYAYPVGAEPDWTMPVYRFWSETIGSHFYTISESERDKLLDDSSVWIYEGIAWYAGE